MCGTDYDCDCQTRNDCVTDWPVAGWPSVSHAPVAYTTSAPSWSPSQLDLEVTTCQGLVNLVPSCEHELPCFQVSACIPSTGDSEVSSLSGKYARFRGLRVGSGTRWPTVQLEVSDNTGRVLGTARVTLDATSTRRHCTTLPVRPRYRDASSAKLCIAYKLRHHRSCRRVRPTLIRRTTLVRVASPPSPCDCQCSHGCH